MKLNFFNGSALHTVRFAMCVLLSALLMLSDHHGGYADRVRNALSLVVYPIRFVVNEAFVSLPNATFGWFTTRQTLLRENEALREERLVLNARLERLREAEEENRRLRALLDFSARIDNSVIVAKVLGVDIDPASNHLELDKGAQHQVRRGQPVIDGRGVLGQIDRAGPLSSAVILITDVNHAIPVHSKRNGLRSIAIGNGAAGDLNLTHISRDDDIREGDLFVTSGLGKVFPPGYPVARVASIRRTEGGGHADVRLEPVADLKRVREVLVMIPSAEAVADADPR